MSEFQPPHQNGDTVERGLGIPKQEGSRPDLSCGIGALAVSGVGSPTTTTRLQEELGIDTFVGKTDDEQGKLRKLRKAKVLEMIESRHYDIAEMVAQGKVPGVSPGAPIIIMSQRLGAPRPRFDTDGKRLG